MYAGLASDRVAWAVLGGYDAAMRKLLAPRTFARASFCVSEERGAHPRFITTRLDEASTLTGTKSFATLATYAEVFVVIATAGTTSDGRNLLRACVVDRDAPGVRVVAHPPLPFAPELPHARLELDHAPVRELLEGDGYERYVKPFRTVEDAHVLLGVLAYAYREAEALGWATAPLERVIDAMLDIADERDPSATETHLLLDVALADARTALEALPWSEAPPPIGERWLRDRPILDVAARARAKRAEKARAR